MELSARPAEVEPAEDAADVGSGRGNRAVVAVVLGVLVLLAGTVAGVVFARSPKHTGASTLPSDHNHPSFTLPSPGRSSTAAATTAAPQTNSLVHVAPALQDQPGISEVVSLFTRYFTAINEKDRQQWQDTLIPRPGLDWYGLRTTKDSQVTISSVNLSASPERASVSFVSHQNPSLGDGSACINWSIVYPLTQYGASLRIDQVEQQIISQQSCD